MGFLGMLPLGSRSLSLDSLERASLTIPLASFLFRGLLGSGFEDSRIRSSQASFSRAFSSLPFRKSAAIRSNSGTKTEVSHWREAAWRRSKSGRACELGLLIERVAQSATIPQSRFTFVGYLGFCARIFLLGCTFSRKAQKAAGNALPRRGLFAGVGQTQ